MLNPSVADLLAGVADALAGTVVGELPPGPARDQVQAAVGLVRRVARALPQLTPYLQADIQDLASTLRDHWASSPEPLPMDEALGAALATAAALPDAPLPDLDALTAVDLRLRRALARLVEDPALNVASEQALRGLFGRMEARQAALGLSPWERWPRGAST